MSAEAVTVVLHHSKSQGSAKLVLWGIANHHSDSGAWPAISTLAKYANIKERRVQQIIRELVDLGEISVDEQGGFGSGQYKTNRYHILIQCPADCDGSLNHKTGVHSVTAGVHSVTVRGATGDTSGVHSTAPELNIKPNKEPIRAATFLSDDFEPSLESVKQMREHFPWVDLKKQTHAFRDYWTSQPPARAKKTDWDATWRNWIRKSADYNQPKEAPQPTKHRFTLEEE